MVLFVMIYLWHKGRMVGYFCQEEWIIWRFLLKVIVMIENFNRIKVYKRYVAEKS